MFALLILNSKPLGIPQLSLIQCSLVSDHLAEVIQGVTFKDGIKQIQNAA